MAKDERINLRVSASQKLLFAKAAEARGVSVSEFILSSASEEAEEALLDRRDFVLSPDAFEQLMEDLSDVKANRATLEKMLSDSSAMEGLSAPQPLSDRHILEHFDSGSGPIDRWLKTKARAAVEQRTAKMFVACQTDEVVGYFALASSRLNIAELPTSLRGNLPNHPIPVVLLARLGVDRKYQGVGLGKALVADAVSRALASNENVAAFALDHERKT